MAIARMPPRWDFVLAFLGAAVSVIVFLLPRTQTSVGIGLFVLFLILVHPVVSVAAWIRLRRWFALVLLVTAVSVFGYFIWPSINEHAPSASEIAREVAKRIVRIEPRPSLPPQPSFPFVTPGVILRKPGGDQWLMLVNHRGPVPAFNVDIELSDVSRLEAAKQGNNEVAAAASSAVIHFPEIDPNGRGAIFAPQFTWTPLAWQHQHYIFNIATRTGRLSEDLYVERSEHGWPSAMRVFDTENNRVLLACRDSEFRAERVPDVPLTAPQCWRGVYGR